MGYHQAGFTQILGIDNAPQPRYPFTFIQADALEFLAGVKPGDYDLVHASPPCQLFSVLTPVAHKARHPDLIEPTRRLLMALRLPYVIENVGGARHQLHEPVKLCGSMFGLGVWRHRYFEAPTLPLALLPCCDHSKRPVLVSGTPKRKGEPRREHTVAERRAAMAIDWMTKIELDQAIPPAYTRFLGEQLRSLFL